MQFLGYFDRVAVINLPERTDRRTDVVRELKRLGLDMHAHKVEFFAAIRPTDAGTFYSRGVRGCFESHLAVLRAARADGLSNILIIEDDFASSDELERLQSRLIAQVARSSWDMVTFGHDQQSDARVEPSLRSPSDLKWGLTHCYAVNARCFDTLISFLEVMQSRPSGHPLGGPMHYDGALHTFRVQHHECEFLIALPSVAGQRSSRSDITVSHLDRLPGLSGALDLMRRSLRFARRRFSTVRKQTAAGVAGNSVFPPG